MAAISFVAGFILNNVRNMEIYMYLYICAA